MLTRERGVIYTYKLYQYNDNDFRVICTKNDPTEREKKEKKGKDNYYISHDDKEIDRIEISRAKRMIREYILSNDFQYFFTATVNSAFCDRFSLTECQKNIRKIMKSIKRNNSDFKYIFITEEHKNGAYHFHGVCTDPNDFYINKNNYKSSASFDKLGFNSFSEIRDKTKCANYITKYITKKCIRNEQGSIYFCSKGLKRALSYEIAPVDLYKFNKKIFENDYIKIVDFTLSNSSQEQLLYMNNFQEKESFLKEFLKKCSII